MITIDRPGYGYSDFERGRTMENWRSDVAAVVQRLGIHQFAVLDPRNGAHSARFHC